MTQNWLVCHPTWPTLHDPGSVVGACTWATNSTSVESQEQGPKQGIGEKKPTTKEENLPSSTQKTLHQWEEVQNQNSRAPLLCHCHLCNCSTCGRCSAAILCSRVLQKIMGTGIFVGAQRVTFTVNIRMVMNKSVIYIVLYWRGQCLGLAVKTTWV